MRYVIKPIQWNIQNGQASTVTFEGPVCLAPDQEKWVDDFFPARGRPGSLSLRDRMRSVEQRHEEELLKWLDAVPDTTDQLTAAVSQVLALADREIARVIRAYDGGPETPEESLATPPDLATESLRASLVRSTVAKIRECAKDSPAFSFALADAREQSSVDEGVWVDAVRIATQELAQPLDTQPRTE